MSIRSISVGAKIPSTIVYENSPGNQVNLAEEVAEGKSIIIGVPGAFSPACSSSHVPGFIKRLRGFNEKGFQKFFVVAVNDAFVTKAWGDALLGSTVAGAQIKFLADPSGAFTKDLDLLFDATKFFGNERSRRYALIVEDGTVTKTFVEPDNTSVVVSDSANVLEEA
ncbi:putative thioredoxin peroxidase [Scheffersomyces stipitis CBS 6054]|uniref:Putative thioredoxin peroxidase n=1 Tax=Scheffersomyces stipitis (strain ATCC 58785 / CBS 6054 / NBRC 10063 / NRRL Y-11545) TaxID=322104 RepID=A3GFW7_PICST|nr:putative thioredoxin peroxidase [Scheffersomyces stipitis CBS 6054]EAZ63834.1 putative thioredoxin peroxidase [Scheffersomyces stipitis CBS 6054]